MRNLRSYYSATITKFLQQSDSEILGVIHANDTSAETTIQQSNTWESEIAILKDQLRSFSDGRIIFEYTIPRMGKRVDNVVLYKNIVFLLEFKCGDNEYRASTYDQVYDYALDLRNFQKESHNKLLVPIMVSTHAPRYKNTLSVRDRVGILTALEILCADSWKLTLCATSYADVCPYVYRQRKNSITSTMKVNDIEQLRDNIIQSIQHCEMENGRNNAFITAAKGYMAYQYSTILFAAHNVKERNIYATIEPLKEYRKILEYSKNRRIIFIYRLMKLIGFKMLYKVTGVYWAIRHL